MAKPNPVTSKSKKPEPVEVPVILPGTRTSPAPSPSHNNATDEIPNERTNDVGQNNQRKRLHVVVLSDTHDEHHTNRLKPYIPDADIFIHCGDFTDRKDWMNLG